MGGAAHVHFKFCARNLTEETDCSSRIGAATGVPSHKKLRGWSSVPPGPSFKEERIFGFLRKPPYRQMDRLGKMRYQQLAKFEHMVEKKSKSDA